MNVLLYTTPPVHLLLGGFFMGALVVLWLWALVCVLKGKGGRHGAS